MKIFQIGKFYSPSLGGIETVLLHLAEGLHGQGHELGVLCSGETSYSTHEWLRGIEVFRAGRYFTLFSQPFSPSILTRFLERDSTYDITHFHSPNPLAEIMGTFLRSKHPMVVTYHSDIVRQKWAIPFYRPVLNAFLDKVDRVIVPTQAHIDYSPFLSRVREKCRIVPFGIDPTPFLEERRNQDTIQQQKQRFGKFLLFVGRLVSYKGVDVAIRAMANIPKDTSLVIVGDGPLRFELEALAETAKVSNRVYILGSVPRTQDLVSLYQGCEAVVLPSVTRAEAFGMVLLEAMACKKPLLTSSLESGVAWVNQDQKTGLHFQVGSPESLAEAATRLLSNEALRTQLGLQGHLRFQESFTREAMIRGYEEVYRELIRS